MPQLQTQQLYLEAIVTKKNNQNAADTSSSCTEVTQMQQAQKMVNFEPKFCHHGI
jgi:hypothetical protein